MPFLFCILCLFTAAQLPVSAIDTSKSIRKVPVAATPQYTKYALVIGVTDYDTCAPLHVCNTDARDFARLLKNRLGFDKVVLMTDDPGTSPQLRPTQRHINIALRSLYDAIIPGKSEVVFYFSGHGTRGHDADGVDTDWLAPEDGDPDHIATSCINYSAIRERLDALGPHRALLVTDACRNLLGSKGMEPNEFGTGLHMGKLGPEVAELQSCRAKQISLEGDPSDFNESVFTHFLILGLSGTQGAVDTRTHAVTFDSLKEYLRSSVQAYAALRKRTQTPDGRASLGSMVLADCDPQARPDPSSEVVKRYVALWTDPAGNILEFYSSPPGMTVGALNQALNAGANVDARAKYGATALMASVASSGHGDVTRFLLAKGADPNAFDFAGNTALMFAVHNDNTEGVKLLIDAGANPAARTFDRSTVLMRAVTGGDANIAATILSGGRQVDAVDFAGTTAMMIAAKCNVIDDVRLFLKDGANPDLQDSGGRTALMHAAERSGYEICRQLLEAGAKPGIVDATGHTAYYYATHPNSLSREDTKAETIAAFTAAGVKE